MKKIAFISIIILLISCYTPLRNIYKKPEKYVNKHIKIQGYAQRWIKSDHGYYFVVITNRYKRYPTIIYKEIPYINLNNRIKASGYIRKYSINKKNYYMLIDSSKAYKIYKFSKDTLKLYFRDSLPPNCLFFIQNNF